MKYKKFLIYRDTPKGGDFNNDLKLDFCDDMKVEFSLLSYRIKSFKS